MTATWPTVVVEVAFTATLSGVTVAPNTPGSTPVWTNLSARAVPAAQFEYGRQYELDQVEVGTLTMMMDNTDEALSPQNTASIYYPYVVSYTPVQVTATWQGVTYSLFTGYVERWPETWTDMGSRGWITVTCVDPLVVLNQFMLQDWTYNEIWQDTPQAFYTMGADAGSTYAADASLSGQQPLTITQVGTGGAVAFGESATLPDSATGVAFTPANSTNYATLRAALPLSGITACECVIVTTTVAAQNVVTFNFPGVSTVLTLGVNASAEATLSVYGAGTVTGTVSLADGQPHHLAFTASADSSSNWTYYLYVDGVLIGSMYAGSAPTFATSGILVGGSGSNPFEGTVSHLALYTETGDIDTLASSGRLAVHAEPCLATQQVDELGYYLSGVEGVSARFSRILGWTGAGLSSAVEGTIGYDIAMDPPFKLGQTTALSAVDDAANTDGGYVYATPAGVVTFSSRYYRWEQTTSIATLGEKDYLYRNAIAKGATPAVWSSTVTYTTSPPSVVTYSGNTYVAIAGSLDRVPSSSPTYWTLVENPYGADIAFDSDPTYIYNVAQVARTNGVTATASNPASITAYYQRVLPKLQLNYHLDSDATNRANWTVAAYGGMYATPAAAPLWSASNAYANGGLCTRLGLLYTATTAVAIPSPWTAAGAFASGAYCSYNGQVYYTTFGQSGGTLAWSSGINYAVNTYVTYGGELWVCVVANNTGQTPGTVPNCWSPQSPDYATGTWTPADPPNDPARWRGPLAVPITRIETITLNPAANPELWPLCLNARMGQRLTVNRRPNATTTYSGDYYIEHVDHDVTRGSATPWTTTLQVAPSELFDVFVLDDPTFGVLDSFNRLGY